MAETTEPKSKRDMMGERLKAKYPDRQYDDDEAMYGQINDDYDQYENELQGYRDREGKLTDMLQRDPRNAQFVVDMARGKDPMTELVRRIGKDGVIEMLEDPAKQEEFAEANRDFAERVAEEERLKAEYDKNLRQSLGEMEQTQQDRGLSDEQIDAAFDLVNKIAHEALLGIYSKETMEIAMKALRYDADIENAANEGEIKGRNAKIEEKMRRLQNSDGMPQLQNGGTAGAPKSNRYNMFDLARQAKS